MIPEAAVDRITDEAVEAAALLTRYEDAIAKVLEVCEEMDVGAQWKSGDPKTKSVAAKAIRASITESLSGRTP